MLLTWDKFDNPRPLRIRKSQEEKGEDGDSLVTFSFTSASKIQQETKPETPHLNIYF